MHEVLEGQGGHDGGHEDNPLMLPVTITLSILAVLVALVTLMGHRAHTEELLLQTQASDQWALFQARNIRLHEMQAVADLLGTLAPVDKDKAEALREKYLKEVERYNQEKEEASDKAKELEKERTLASRRADRFDAGEVFLEIGLIISSFTLLTSKKLFWYVGILLGIMGALIGVTGFLLH
jgi:Domain of unknown function (DUF4337)